VQQQQRAQIEINRSSMSPSKQNTTGLMKNEQHAARRGA